MKIQAWLARACVFPLLGAFALFQVAAAALALTIYDSLPAHAAEPFFQPITSFFLRLFGVFVVSGFVLLFLALRLVFSTSSSSGLSPTPLRFRAAFALGLLALAALWLTLLAPMAGVWRDAGRLSGALDPSDPAAVLAAFLLLAFPASVTLAALSSVLFALFCFLIRDQPRRAFLSSAFAGAIAPLSCLLAAWMAAGLGPHARALMEALDPRFAWKPLVLDWLARHPLDEAAIAGKVTPLVCFHAVALFAAAVYRLRIAAGVAHPGPAPKAAWDLSLLAREEPEPPPPSAPAPPPLPPASLTPEWRHEAYQVLPGKMLAPAFYENAQVVFRFDDGQFQLRQSGDLLDAAGASVLHIVKRSMSAAHFDIDDPVRRGKVGAFERGKILDASGSAIGHVQELERNANIARYQIWLGSSLVAAFTHYTGLASSELDADFSHDSAGILDRRLGLALALILRSRPAPAQ
jgi:hypothetical protein